jgi:hypothetical protein
VPRSERHSFRLPEVTQPVFDVVLLVEPADESHGLLSRSESPFTGSLRKRGSQRMFRRLPQCSRMACLGVSRKLRWMTALALLASCVLALRNACQKQEKENSYQTNLPLN